MAAWALLFPVWRESEAGGAKSGRGGRTTLYDATCVMCVVRIVRDGTTDKCNGSLPRTTTLVVPVGRVAERGLGLTITLALSDRTTRCWKMSIALAERDGFYNASRRNKGGVSLSEGKCVPAVRGRVWRRASRA